MLSHLIVVFILSSAYYDMVTFYCRRHLITVVYLSSVYYDMMFLRIVTMLYSRHYIIKFINFMSTYYAINMDIVSSYIIFNNLYLEAI